MALRGFLLCAQGALFILLPGYVMFHVLRRAPKADRSLIYWGAGGLLAASLPMNFFISLGRQILAASPNTLTVAAQLLCAALLTGIFVEGMKYLLLKVKHLSGPELVPGGIAVGLGVGFVTQVFYGLLLVGMGTRLLLGDTSTVELADMAARSVPELSLAALASLIGRVSLLVLNACLGVVAARAIVEKSRKLLLYAMLVHAGIELSYSAITVGLAGHGQVAILLAMAFETVVTAVGWPWLQRQLQTER